LSEDKAAQSGNWDEDFVVKTSEDGFYNDEEYKLSTEEGVGCPKCDNKEVYLVQCHKMIYKACDKCKTIYLCRDACEVFTDPELKLYCDENPDKTIEDYKTMKYAWMNKKFADYVFEDHPEIS